MCQVMTSSYVHRGARCSLLQTVGFVTALFGASVGYGASQIYSDVVVTTGTDSARAEEIGVTKDVTRSRSTLGLRQDLTWHGTSIDVAITSLQRDLDRVIVMDRQGTDHSLADMGHDDHTLQGDTTISYAKGLSQVAVSLSLPLTNDPFASRYVQGEFSLPLPDNRTTWTLALGYQTSSRPESYFVDNEARTQALATTGIAQEYRTGLQVIATPNLKLAIEGLIVGRGGERPATVGGKLQSRHALTDTLYASLSAASYQDRRDFQPKDTRGYLEMQVYEATVTIEPVFDLLLTGSYAVVFEKEHSTGDAVDNRRLNTDQVGLALEYKALGYELGASIAFLQTDLETREQHVGGNILWRI